MKIDIHRYKLKEGCIPQKVDASISVDGDISLVSEWGERAPSKETWYDDDFDFRYFLVLDESFCQPYMPFYRWWSGDSEPGTEYQMEIVRRYNEFLDGVDWLERIR